MIEYNELDKDIICFERYVKGIKKKSRYRHKINEQYLMILSQIEDIKDRELYEHYILVLKKVVVDNGLCKF